MPKFFIGCPIKKNRGDVHIGLTGRLVELEPSSEEDAKYGFDAVAVLDQTAVDVAGVVPAGVRAAIKLEQWDPIVPDGMKPVEQDSLLCLPDGSFNDLGVLTPYKEELYA